MPLQREDTCFWRWRFQPVYGLWGHLAIDYTFEDPDDDSAEFLLRHVDYGLPGDSSQSGYRQSIARYEPRDSPDGRDWPPVRTPFGRLYFATRFIRAPRVVGEFLKHRLPRFYGPCGAYRLLGPNSNSGLAAAVVACESGTGYRFRRPPWPWRLAALGWKKHRELEAHDGPCPGYFYD